MGETAPLYQNGRVPSAPHTFVSLKGYRCVKHGENVVL